jgi:RNA polymerase sigma-70 factor (ECF subfamily)
MTATIYTTSRTTIEAPQASALARPAISAEERKQALQELYDRHVEQIYRFVYFKVGNREDAEDITAQVFMKAANSLDVQQEESARLAWLYQVARTTITDHWRAYYKGPMVSLDELEEVASLNLTAPASIQDAPDQDPVNPAAEKVRAILNSLPEKYRRVLELRFLQGCSLKETAEAMGITEGNAKVLQHRALHKAISIASQSAAAH